MRSARGLWGAPTPGDRSVVMEDSFAALVLAFWRQRQGTGRRCHRDRALLCLDRTDDRPGMVVAAAEAPGTHLVHDPGRGRGSHEILVASGVRRHVPRPSAGCRHAIRCVACSPVMTTGVPAMTGSRPGLSVQHVSMRHRQRRGERTAGRGVAHVGRPALDRDERLVLDRIEARDGVHVTRPYTDATVRRTGPSSSRSPR